MKPRVKFYSNGLLIIESENEASIEWFWFLQYKGAKDVAFSYNHSIARDFKLIGWTTNG